MDTQRLSQTVQPLLDWFQTHARTLPWRADREPYHVWLSEIMLQQTRVEAVRGYYARFLAAAPDVFALAALPEAQLLKLWEGLGYYNRARKAQECARVIAARGGAWPDTVEGLLALPGIGPYTAGAIASICFERPAAAVDGNVLRVVSRVTGSDAPIDKPETKKKIAADLSAVYPAGHCGDFTQSLMELGATVCTPRGAKCGGCPLADICAAKREDRVDALPVKGEKRARKIEARTVFFLECDGAVAVCRRPPRGLLASMWQLPNLDGSLDVQSALSAAADLGVQPIAIERAIDRVHVFTHIEWQMTCYYLRCAVKAPAFVWASRAELSDRYALPTAFRQFVE